MRSGVIPLPEPDETHLWLLPLDTAEDELARLAGHLTADEDVRARRFRFERDRDRFVAARGQLREVLAAYLGRAPARITLQYGPRGKPRLAGDDGRARLGFSLAHAGRRALVGIACGREIGVDLEEVRPERLGPAAAALFLSDAERREIDRLGPVDRARALLSAWVQKEAYAKARGDGLALDLRSIEVDVRPDGPGGLRRAGGRTGAASWALRTLEVGPEFAGALAVEGAAGRLAWWTAEAQAAR
jgi:4'-phosphopantetheinyl transferase